MGLMSKSDALKTFMMCTMMIVAYFSVVYLAEFYLKLDEKNTLYQTLRTHLTNSHTALKSWHEKQQKVVHQVSLNPALQAQSATLSKIRQTLPAEELRRQLQVHTSQETIATTLAPWIDTYDVTQYYLISPSGIILASSLSDRIGNDSVIARRQPELFNDILNGDIKITKPVVALKRDGSSEKAAYLYALAPVFSANIDRPNVLAFQIDAAGSYATNFEIGRFGTTGETYAFDDEGRFLSESRFKESYLKSLGLNHQDTGILVTVARDPSKRFERDELIARIDNGLTYMAASAVQGVSSVNLNGYNNHRDIQVVGMWLWDRSLGLGMATEISLEEAFTGLTTSMTLIKLLAFVALAALLFTVFQIRSYARKRSDHELALTRARDTAELANHSKSVFLSSMSHELRTPLNAVIGFGQILLKSKEILDNEELKDSARNIVNSGTHLLRLLNEVLDFAKMDVGELSFEYVPINVHSIIEDCVAMVNQEATNRGIKIVTEHDLRHLPDFIADETRTKQILVNFLTNAVKYNSENGHVFIRVDHEHDELRFNVRDTGKGIDAKDLKQVWEPFNRAGAENTDIDGSGIGLAFSKKIIEAMGGQVGASSVLGLGSTFWFSLPLSEIASKKASAARYAADTGADHLEESTETAPRRNLKTLCLEDMVLNQKIIAKMLDQNFDHATTFCSTGSRGLDLLKTETFDIILLDLNLPDMSGFEFQETLIRENLAPDTPVVVVSADVSSTTMAKVQDAGIVAFVPKPIRLADLSLAIDKALELKEKPDQPSATSIAVKQ
ncbi:hybrid sensor histidine kinase/response regulator [Kordiimonas sediminis]|nr:ATP-binding protein [Kordiimonas sediminis]